MSDAGPEHLRLLQEILALFGAKSAAPPLMFRDHWRSRRNRAVQAALTAWFIASAVVRPNGKIIIHGTQLSALRGEVMIDGRCVRATALALAASRRPFIVAPIRHAGALPEIIARLGLDRDAPISAFLSINSLLVLFARRDGRPVVIHAAGRDEARRTLDNHIRGLTMARSAGLPPEAAALLAEPLAVAEATGRRLLMQSRLPGVALDFHALTEAQLWSALMSAMQAVHRLHECRVPATGGADRDLIFDAVPAMFAQCPELEQPLRGLLDHIQAWQRQNAPDAVLTHGDYWLRNLLFDPATFAVLGIVDWEMARLHGTPGFDAVHLGLMTYAIECDRPIAEYIVQVLAGDWDEPLLKAYLLEVCRAFDLSMDTIEHIAVLIYFSQLQKVIAANQDISDARRSALLTRPLAAITAWLAGKQDAVAGLQDVNEADR